MIISFIDIFTLSLNSFKFSTLVFYFLVWCVPGCCNMLLRQSCSEAMLFSSS